MEHLRVEMILLIYILFDKKKKIIILKNLNNDNHTE